MFLIAICAGLLGLLFIQRPCTIRSTSTPRVASTHTSLTSYPSLKSPTRADPGLLEPYDFTSSRSRGFAFDSSPHGYYNQVGAFWTYFTGFWPWRPSDLHLDTSLQNGGHPTSIWTYHYKMEAAQYLWTLLTDQHQNFIKWALFGQTLQDSDHGGHLTSIWT